MKCSKSQRAVRTILLVLCWALTVQTTYGQGAQRIIVDLTAMYDAVNPSIVKIYADASNGSGFLVRSDGLIATNHHVVSNARYIAVEFADGKKVTADVVLLDSKNDLAILKVNRSVTENLKPLVLIPPDRDSTVRAGLPVVAFGSPRNQTFLMTQGIVSKVEPAVLLGDFLIDSGNSGGPLINLDGEVIGINTFTVYRLSGAVRVSVLRQQLSSKTLDSSSLTEPSDKQLPVPDRDSFPTSLLKEKILKERLDIRNYKIDGGRFTVTAITPVLAAKANVQDDLEQAANRYARRGKKIKDEKFDPVDEPFYEWVRNAAPDTLAKVVTFQIEPDYGQTAGSFWGGVISAAAAGAAQRAIIPTRQTYEFKAEFAGFSLYRDGELVQPITPGRAITSQSVDLTFLNFVDEAYSGIYIYEPQVFMTGKEWRIDIYDARDSNKIHKSIILNQSSKLIQQIRKDFEGVVK